MAGSDSMSLIFDASYARLVAQLIAICGSQDDAEDAVQEAFVKAIRHGLADSTGSSIPRRGFAPSRSTVSAPAGAAPPS